MIQNELKQHGKSWNKFADVQSSEIQILEEEKNANMQQKLNTSTCSVCNKDATDKYISCSECHIQLHYRCTFLQSYRLYYFVEKKSKYTCVNCTPTGLVDLSSDGVDVLINDIKEHLVKVETINNLLREENRHLRGENVQNINNLKVEKTINTNNVKGLETKIKKMQTELSEVNRMLAEKIKEINRRKHQINKDTDISCKPNTIDASINEDINIKRNNGNDERFIDEFVDFKKFVTMEFQNINQKVASLNMKDQYPQGNTLNEQQKEWMEAHSSSKINRNSTKRYKPIASRNKFQPIYIQQIDLKEDDAHTNNLLINNLAIQNTRRPSPVVNKYPDRDLLHHQIKKATTSIVPGNTDLNNAVKFGPKMYILGTSMVKGIRRKEFNSKLNKCSTRFRPFLGATMK